MVDVAGLLLVLAAAVEIAEQVVSSEVRRVDGEQLLVAADRRRLQLAVPAGEILPPELALEDGGACFEPPADLGMAAGELLPDLARRMLDRLLGRTHRPRAEVPEPVDERVVEVVKQ